MQTSMCGKNILTGSSTDFSPSMRYQDCGLSGPLDNSQVTCCCPGTYKIDEGQMYREGEGAAKVPEFVKPKLSVSGDIVSLTDAKCKLNPDGTSHCSIPWLGQYVVAIYNYGLSIAGILAAIMLMAGGVLWLVSGGDSGKVGQAKELITGSIIGLVILASSYIILTQINPNLTKFGNISLGAISYEDVEPVSNEGNASYSNDCNNCVTLSVPYKDGGQANASLSTKLTTAWNNSAGLAWRVTEAYPPVVKHQSTCHYNGMCADVALTSDKSCTAVNNLITIMQNAGLSVLNEYTGCGGTATTYATGGHLHVK